MDIPFVQIDLHLAYDNMEFAVLTLLSYWHLLYLFPSDHRSLNSLSLTKVPRTLLSHC